jgi:glucosamine-6-phosphate deaminase
MNKHHQEKRFEKIPTTIFDDSAQASKHVASSIASLIREKAKKGEKAILGLATGSSPTGIYNELVRLHHEEGLSFKNVITFNLDEYYPMQPNAVQSYVRFMHEYLFDRIDIPKENIHIPDGTQPIENVSDYCEAYDRQIDEAGGIDIQVLGIGRTGHIGFNEPGSSIDSPTRLINLDNITIADAASDFFDEKNVPRRAITMGIGSILKARKVVLLAWGETKAHVLQRAIEKPINEKVPASFLQRHPNAEIIADEASAAELCRRKTPWIVKTCDWYNDRLVRKAAVWLCQKVDKPVLKLTDRDYNDSGLSDLLTQYNSAYNINIKVFNDLQHTISGWPGGKPNADDSHRPERKSPYPKRVLVFSPHPDDDVISMGGTLSRLVDQGHEVHVVYQTSGSIAVFDDDVLKYLDFVGAFKEITGIEENISEKFIRETVDFINTKRPMQVDTGKVQLIKAAIRKGEARSACRFVQIPPANIHFLNMPFYETGKVRKKPLGGEDIQLVVDILQQIKPHQIFAAGDLTDPHGTHRTCIKAIFSALEQVKDEPWVKQCNLWLYRGAWQEWDIDQADMAVPLSPDEVARKRMAIFKHQSQKDRPLFPGSDPREFWKRAEDRNHETAVLYDRLGMAEYEAIEVFAKRGLFDGI